MTEKELIQGLKNNNQQAFKALVDLYQVKVRNVCTGIINNKFEADDVAQEVFIAVYRSIHKFKADSTLFTWIYRISINHSLNYVRNKKRKRWLSFFSGFGKSENEIKEIPDTHHPENILENQQTLDILQKSIDSLPENQRVAFVLSKYEGLSTIDIAKILDTSTSSVESLNFRAKKNLQKILSSLKNEFPAQEFSEKGVK